jgi:hypothetical protein
MRKPIRTGVTKGRRVTLKGKSAARKVPVRGKSAANKPAKKVNRGSAVSALARSKAGGKAVSALASSKSKKPMARRVKPAPKGRSSLRGRR